MGRRLTPLQGDLLRFLAEAGEEYGTLVATFGGGEGPADRPATVGRRFPEREIVDALAWLLDAGLIQTTLAAPEASRWMLEPELPRSAEFWLTELGRRALTR